MTKLLIEREIIERVLNVMEMEGCAGLAADALREALAEHIECSHGVEDGTCKECYMEQTYKPLHHYALVLRDIDKTVEGWCEEPEFYLNGERVYAEQAEQEPVAWMVTMENQDGTKKTFPLSGRYKDVCDTCDFGDPIPLYAAPVRTKDLTDDEIHKALYGKDTLPGLMNGIRAVIQEFRRKNGIV